MNYLEILNSKNGEELFLLGNEAVTRGALESGINVYTYYPGTPSSEVGEIFTNIFSQSKMSYVESSINILIKMELLQFPSQFLRSCLKKELISFLWNLNLC